MSKEQMINEIERIIYWWRRYKGRRDIQYQKVWLATDLDLLERRIAEYIKYPKKFKFNNGD